MKKAMYQILALMFCVGVLLCLGSAAWADGTIAASGTFGELSWTLDDEGLLTVTGSGEMGHIQKSYYDPYMHKTRYEYDNTLAWHPYKNQITRAIVGEGVTSLGNWAFYRCENMTQISLPASVTEIGHDAFGICGTLTSAEIPDGVTCIDSGTFSACTGMTSVTIPASVNTIADSAFNNCLSLGSVAIPAGVTSIGNSAFRLCRSLRSMVIPSGVTSIGSFTFENCSGLMSVTIPASVTAVNIGAFDGCERLAGVFYGGTQEQWESISIDAYNDPLLNATVCYGLVPDFILPASLTSIGRAAFMGGAFTFVKLPENAVSIGARAFADCPNLAYIYIPADTTDISADAFYGVTGLTIIGAPNSTAGNYAQDHGFHFIPMA